MEQSEVNQEYIAQNFPFVFKCPNCNAEWDFKNNVAQSFPSREGLLIKAMKRLSGENWQKFLFMAAICFGDAKGFTKEDLDEEVHQVLQDEMKLRTIKKNKRVPKKSEDITAICHICGSVMTPGDEGYTCPNGCE